MSVVLTEAQAELLEELYELDQKPFAHPDGEPLVGPNVVVGRSLIAKGLATGRADGRIVKLTDAGRERARKLEGS